MSFSFKKIARASLVCCLAISFGTATFAQNQNNSGTQSADTSVSKNGPRKQISIIFLSGLGGAVLGLSTLSFYGRPQDHMSNIAMGFALGVITGTIYVTYNTAKKPKDYLSESSGDQSKVFVPAQTTREYLTARRLNPQLFSYTFRF